MKPSRVVEVLTRLLSGRWPVFVWGPPGAGKSSIVQHVAQSKRMRVIDIRAPLLDPTDLRGIPTVSDGSARWCPPSFLPNEPESGILFFDELNAAPAMVQASLYQLTLDRRVGEYVLPEGWRIVAAGNRAEDRAVVFRMPSALANRFVHIDFEIDFDDWRSWALRAGLHPHVIGFLSLRRELLFDMTNPDRGFPTPRSWEMASDTLRSMEDVEDIGDVLLGVVGEGATIEFMAYFEAALSEDAIQSIVADPENAKLPTAIGDLYALVSYLGSHAKTKTVRRAIGVLLDRLSPELAVLVLADVLRVYPKAVVEEKEISEFAKQHGSLLL